MTLIFILSYFSYNMVVYKQNGWINKKRNELNRRLLLEIEFVSLYINGYVNRNKIINMYVP